MTTSIQKAALLFLMATASAVGQVSTATTTAAAATEAALDVVKLPSYIAFGGAYNQITAANSGHAWSGANAFVGTIFPVANKIGLYDAVVCDLYPLATTVNNATVYLVQTSLREEIHKTLYSSAKNTVMVGLGAGAVFSSATSGTSTTSTTSGASGTATTSFTGAMSFTWVHQLSPHWSLLLPIRMVYLPQGWNPIAQIAIAWKPGTPAASTATTTATVPAPAKATTVTVTGAVPK